MYGTGVWGHKEIFSLLKYQIHKRNTRKYPSWIEKWKENYFLHGFELLSKNITESNKMTTLIYVNATELVSGLKISGI